MAAGFGRRWSAPTVPRLGRSLGVSATRFRGGHHWEIQLCHRDSPWVDPELQGGIGSVQVTQSLRGVAEPDALPPR